MFTEELNEESQDPQKDMKIKMLDDLIEKIMMMDDAKEEKAEVDSSNEMSQEDDSEMKDKLAKMKGI